MNMIDIWMDLTYCK